MNKLNNKVAIVTGVSKGIGAAIVREIAQQGAAVVVNYLSDQKGGEAVVEDIIRKGGKAVAVQADVSKAAGVKMLFEEAKKAFGPPGILVNNAGVYRFEPIETVTEEEFHRQFDRNVLSVLLCIQEALTYFGEKGGSIITISSVASVRATPMSAVYSASKSAVDSMTRTLSKELGAKKIRINSILPGPTQTEGNQVIGTDAEQLILANTPMGRVGQPEDVAQLAVFLASDDTAWITGQKICVSGGFD